MKTKWFVAMAMAVVMVAGTAGASFMEWDYTHYIDFDPHPNTQWPNQAGIIGLYQNPQDLVSGDPDAGQFNIQGVLPFVISGSSGDNWDDLVASDLPIGVLFEWIRSYETNDWWDDPWTHLGRESVAFRHQFANGAEAWDAFVNGTLVENNDNVVLTENVWTRITLDPYDLSDPLTGIRGVFSFSVYDPDLDWDGFVDYMFTVTGNPFHDRNNADGWLGDHPDSPFAFVTQNYQGRLTAEIVPEPATMSLLGLGLAGLALKRFRSKRS